MTTSPNNPNLRKLPLYEEILKRLNEKSAKGNFSINAEFKTKLCNILCSLQKDQCDQIGLLIIHYYFLTGDGNPFNREDRSIQLPFGIKENPSGKGCSFDVDNLPLNLQVLLGIYCGL